MHTIKEGTLNAVNTVLPKHVYYVEIRRKNRVRNLVWKQSHTRDSNPGPSLGRPEARPPGSV